MSRVLTFVLAGALVCGALAGGARADTTWEKVSPTVNSNLVVASLARDGDNVVAAWGYGPTTSTGRLEALTFRTSRSDDVINPVGPHAAADNWRTVGSTPQLFPKPGGGLQVVFGGFRTTQSSDPLAGASALSPRNVDGTFGAPVAAGRPYTGLGDALLLPNGTPLFTSNHTGQARVLRGVDPNQNGVDLQSVFGGSDALGAPRLGVDGMGRVWVAWYSSTRVPETSGIIFRQYDPVAHAGVGAPQKAPSSDSATNNSFRAAFACAVICRAVYGVRLGQDEYLASWAPGESAVTRIVDIERESAGRVVTASYAPDGRLWVAWVDDDAQRNDTYHYTLGDATGKGGTVTNAGHPPDAGRGSAWGLNSLPVGSDLLLAANYQSGEDEAIWINNVSSGVSIGDASLPQLPEQLPPPRRSVAVNLTGTGTVTSAPSTGNAAAAAAAPVACGPARFACYTEVAPGTRLTLRARPAAGFVFRSWSGACSGSAPTCTVGATASRSLTAFFGPRSAASTVAAAMRPPRARVRWQSSVGHGSLAVTARVASTARVRLELRRPAGGPLLTHRLNVRGTFRQSLDVGPGKLTRGARIFPGGFVVSLIGSAGGRKVPLQVQTLTLPAPREGFVRSSYVTTRQGGRRLLRLPRQSREAWAYFVFHTQPRAGQPLSVSWYTPQGRLLGTVQKTNRPEIFSFVRSSAPLARGMWRAELRAGGRIVKRLRVRIG
jgi:hypothetical protein